MMAKQRDPACSSELWIRLATVISVVLLAVIAAVVSFGHMRELALRHGEARWSATLIPLSVDGMVVAASMSVLLAGKMGRRGEWLPWALLIVGSLASLAANVAVASPTTVGRLIAAWPSFAFVGAYHLLQGQLRIGRVDLIAPVEEPATYFEGRSLGDGTEGAWLLASPGRRLQRQAWAWALANRSAEGQLPVGAVIAERFSRSPRWGRLVKRAGDVGSLEPPRDEAASGAE
jgi:Protein of unknown function (DUF2637)